MWYVFLFVLLQQHASDNAPLRVVVRVRDGEDHGEDVLDAAVPVFVSLLDVNDNSPVITNLPVEVSLREVYCGWCHWLCSDAVCTACVL